MYKHSINSPWDIFKRTNIGIIRLPKGKWEEQETEHLSEKIMKENFPRMVKEIDKSRKHRDTQRTWTQRGSHQHTS